MVPAVPQVTVLPAPQTDETVTGFSQSLYESEASQNFTDMSVEQLKAYLSAKGVSSGELRGLVKAELIDRAEAVNHAESENA